LTSPEPLGLLAVRIIWVLGVAAILLTVGVVAGGITLHDRNVDAYNRCLALPHPPIPPGMGFDPFAPCKRGWP
jgi:hypothetical protein